MSTARKKEPSSPLPPGDVRGRLIDAMTKAAVERGYANTTVEDALRCAGLSRAAFDEHFSGKDQCLIAAFDAFVERFWVEVLSAVEEETEWPAQVNAAIIAILAFLSERAAMARLFTIEITAIGPAFSESQFVAARRFAGLLRTGRERYPAAASLPDSAELMVTTGILARCSVPLLAEEPGTLPGLRAELVEFILTPYIGGSEARRFARL